jgi:hypothetical protein
MLVVGEVFLPEVGTSSMRSRMPMPVAVVEVGVEVRVVVEVSVFHCEPMSD